MKKRRLLLVASLPLAITVIFGVLAMEPPRPGVTKANFDRLQKGMTKPEVERILGRSPDRIQGGPDVGDFYWLWINDDLSSAVLLSDPSMKVKKIAVWVESPIVIEPDELGWRAKFAQFIRWPWW